VINIDEDENEISTIAVHIFNNMKTGLKQEIGYRNPNSKTGVEINM
jgi:hypothetical protein